VLDSNRPTAPGSAQYEFAHGDLATHQASAWRIVVVHQPVYSSTTPRSSSLTLRAALAPLFQQQRVDLVLSGNVHNYERTHPLTNGRPAEGGVTYVVSGGGGNGLNPITRPKPRYSAFREAAYYEFVRVTVTPEALVIEAIRADNGAVFDTATIRRH
jgi:Iron/zinc purple acid phosphatase-like protein C